MNIHRSTLAACLALSLCVAGRAESIDYTHITIADSSPGFNADFDVSNIVTNQANLPNTDGFSYASASAGTDTFVDFAFDGAYAFDEVTVIDRLHSGAAADTIGGTADFVTEYDLIFSANSTFGDGDDTTISVGPIAVPDAPSGIDDFTTVNAIGNVEAQYVRFDVTAANGAKRRCSHASVLRSISSRAINGSDDSRRPARHRCVESTKALRREYPTRPILNLKPCCPIRQQGFFIKVES